MQSIGRAQVEHRQRIGRAQVKDRQSIGRGQVEYRQRIGRAQVHDRQRTGRGQVRRQSIGRQSICRQCSQSAQNVCQHLILDNFARETDASSYVSSQHAFFNLLKLTFIFFQMTFNRYDVYQVQCMQLFRLKYVSLSLGILNKVIILRSFCNREQLKEIS